MIQITAQMRVLVAIEPVDGRKGIDSLARLCQEKLAEDPFSGCVFVLPTGSVNSRLVTLLNCLLIRHPSSSTGGILGEATACHR